MSVGSTSEAGIETSGEDSPREPSRIGGVVRGGLFAAAALAVLLLLLGWLVPRTGRLANEATPTWLDFAAEVVTAGWNAGAALAVALGLAAWALRAQLLRPICLSRKTRRSFRTTPKAARRSPSRTASCRHSAAYAIRTTRARTALAV